MKTIINENQRGFLFCNGRFVKMLEAGKHRVLYGRQIEVVAVEQPVCSVNCSLDVLLKDENVTAQTTIVQVADEQLALHFVNGKFLDYLRQGRHAFWSIYDKHEFTIIDTSIPEVSPEFPQYIFSKLPSHLFIRVEVAEFQKARLHYNQRLIRLLDAGIYYFWKNGVKIDVSFVDTRLTQMELAGQEILTLDKVPLRINFVCNYRITDYVKILTEIDNYTEQIHVAAQRALRGYVGKYRIDEILENKDQISAYVLFKLK